MMIFVGLFALAMHPRRAAAQAAPQSSARAAGLPRVENANVQTQALSTNLEAAVSEIAGRSVKPLWIAYTVVALPGDHSACCGTYSDGHHRCGRCRLEKSSDGLEARDFADAEQPRRIMHLEQPRQLAVLLRVENREVMRVRLASEDCVLDAGGLPLIWLTGVLAADSVALLSRFVTKGDFSEYRHDHFGDGALTAIALHGDPAADRAMESFVAPQQNEHLRKQAVFWLGAARGKPGLALLEHVAKNDPSPEIRSQVAFAFEVSREPGAVEDMIRMAHDDESSHVRGQALFWLAQKAGQKAVGAIQGAIENDPDTEVKKKAVFALSQLPKDQGVPKLIEVAQTNRNPEVRKQAMFWLGQSQDPRALDFFEKILSR
jgi:hypothetical protein